MSIPASQIVSVNPGVIASGGNSLALNGLFLTQNPLMPAGKVINFLNAKAVSAFFGPASDEYALALLYFAGYVNSSIKPGGMLFAPYNAAVRAAFLQSGPVNLSLTALKALTGVLTITVDGTAKTSANINLSGATSFSNAATIIAAAFTNGPSVTWNPVNSTFLFTSPTTGLASSMSFATGSLAAALMLMQGYGGNLSAGAIADTPASAMLSATTASQNFATFTTLFEPAFSDKINFATWSAAQNSRFMYVAWDTDPQAVVQGSATSFGAIAKAAAYDGVIAVSGDNNLAGNLATTARALATFVCATVASINFSQPNGRITSAFKSGAAMATTVEDPQLASNLLANGYNYYGAYATANQGFTFFYSGQLTGQWLWLDNFVNQVYLNSQMQLALLTLVTQIGSIPYNVEGYSLVRAALSDPIRAALNFGTIRTGVTLSATQTAQVNQASGVNAATLISSLGYYLQIVDPGAQARSLRQTPIINLWYADGAAIQQVSLASTDIL